MPDFRPLLGRLSAGFRPPVSHLGFSVVFTLLLYGVCNALNLDRLSRWFPGSAVAFAAYLVAGYCLFLACFLLLAHRRTTKPLALLLCASSAAATYFIAKYDVAIDGSMIRNALHTDATEVDQLASTAMLPYVAGLFLLPGALILATRIEFRGPLRSLGASFAWIGLSLAIAATCLYANVDVIQRAGNVSNKYILYSLVPDNLLYGGISLAAKSASPFFTSRPKGADIDVEVSHPENLVVVLAVGESSRRASFSLYGYGGHDTNPLLRTVPGLHALPGIARRGSTLYALPQILEKDGIKLTEVVSRAGVPVSCLVNYSLYDNCRPFAQTAPTHCSHADRCYDEDVLPLLRQRLAHHANGKELIVLHFGGGSHGPIYRDRHPPEFLRFEPTCDDADIATRCTPDQIHDSYDNTILYVDYVVDAAIRSLDAAGIPYVFIYLSDHGESLMEGGRMFHGMPPGVALPPEQAAIPLLVKASTPIRIPPRAEYSQPAVFDSVLNLLSISVRGLETSGAFILR